MLHCNIALAASGANSQLSDARRGEFCESGFAPRWHSFDIYEFSSLARLLLRNEHKTLPIGVSNGSARESARTAPSVAHDPGRLRSDRRGFRLQPDIPARPACRE